MYTSVSNLDFTVSAMYTVHCRIPTGDHVFYLSHGDPTMFYQGRLKICVGSAIDKTRKSEDNVLGKG